MAWVDGKNVIYLSDYFSPIVGESADVQPLDAEGELLQESSLASAF